MGGIDMFDKEKLRELPKFILQQIRKGVIRKQEKIQYYKERDSHYDTEVLTKRIHDVGCSEEKMAIMQLLAERRKDGDDYEDDYEEY